MKAAILPLFLLLSSVHSMASEYLGKWTETLEHELVINCSEGEFLCRDLCGKEQCKIKQAVCRNCIGTNVMMAHIFQNFSESYSLTGRSLDEKEVIQYLTTRKFVSIEPDSPFNVLDEVSSHKFERQLSKLCGGIDPYPLLLATLQSSTGIKSLDYLVCHTEDGARVMELTHSPEVVIGLPLNL